MINDIREKYKINKSETEKSYEYHLGLKNNKEYEERVDNTFLQIVNLFCNRYKGVSLDYPRGREKSKKSLKNKIDRLEIERLCTIYAINNLTDEEKENLYKLLIDKTSKVELFPKINKIIFGKLSDLKYIEDIMKEKNLSENIKRALLRITKTRIEKEKNDEIIKSKYIRRIDEKYGEEAARKSGKLEKNIAHFENIEKARNNSEIMNKLYNPQEYLKIKDLRGFKIVISNVPSNIKTDNEKIKELIKKRENEDKKNKNHFDDLCCIEIEKDFANYLQNNIELLNEMNLRLVGRKEKDKQNGYIADHLKFCYLDHDEYNFELQIRSIYTEERSRLNGTAAHDRRAGKKRIFPSTNNKEEFIKQLDYSTPKYTLLEKKDNKYSIKKCNLKESMMEYYLGYINLDSKTNKKVQEYLSDEKSEER